MHFDDPAIRAAYRRGVSDAYHSSCIHLPGTELTALDHWIAELSVWKGGRPPQPPYLWAANSN